MRKLVILFALLFASCLVYLAYAHFSGGAVPTFGLPIGGEKAVIRARTIAFFEHVKFKNANAFTDFVENDHDQHEVVSYLTKTLGMPQENVDLMSVSIDDVELDSTKSRARVRVRLLGQSLTDRSAIDQSKVIFLYKNVAGSWMIDTKSLSS